MHHPPLNPGDAASATGRTPRHHLLIIEDDRDQRNALAMRLRHEGYEVSAAEDAHAAIRAARLQRPDLILLDLGIPGGGGYGVLERLQALTELCDIPVVVLSAWNAATERPRALLSGAVAYYQKPIANNVLRAMLIEHLGT